MELQQQRQKQEISSAEEEVVPLNVYINFDALETRHMDYFKTNLCLHFNNGSSSLGLISVYQSL